MELLDTKKSVFDKIFEHLTTISFGHGLSTNTQLLDILKTSIPVMSENIAKNHIHDIKIKMATDIATSISGENYGRLRSDDERRLCFEAAFVMLFALRSENDNLIYKTVEELKFYYPEFHDCKDVELGVLLTFRNVMRIAQELIQPRYHKKHLLDLVTRITEGHMQRYVTGSGQTLATKRRVTIYQREGNVKPLPRPPRKNEILKKRAFQDDSSMEQLSFTIVSDEEFENKRLKLTHSPNSVSLPAFDAGSVDDIILEEDSGHIVTILPCFNRDCDTNISVDDFSKDDHYNGSNFSMVTCPTLERCPTDSSTHDLEIFFSVYDFETDTIATRSFPLCSDQIFSAPA
jgi:hypothetical protein